MLCVCAGLLLLEGPGFSFCEPLLKSKMGVTIFFGRNSGSCFWGPQACYIFLIVFPSFSCFEGLGLSFCRAPSERLFEGCNFVATMLLYPNNDLNDETSALMKAYEMSQMSLLHLGFADRP